MRKFIVLLFIVVPSIYGCNLISAGSFPYAERYKYKITEDSLIHILESLKANDSSLVIPEGYRLADGRGESSTYWYYIYFYNKSRDEIMLTWVRKDRYVGYTNLAFVAVKKKEDVGNWRNINKDFSSAENRARKEEFRALILDRIHLPVEED